MRMNTDREWLLRMAAKEDGCFVGVGALNTANSVSTVTEETLSDVVLPTYCGCNELLQNLQELETHVERGCWRESMAKPERIAAIQDAVWDHEAEEESGGGTVNVTMEVPEVASGQSSKTGPTGGADTPLTGTERLCQQL